MHHAGVGVDAGDDDEMVFLGKRMLEENLVRS